MQRLPVRIRLDQDALEKHPLRIGLSMNVDVDLHDLDGPVLAQKPLAQPRYATDVYTRQLEDADRLIERLIHENGPASRDVAKR